MSIPFVYASYLYWKMGVDENVTQEITNVQTIARWDIQNSYHIII